MMQIYQSAAKAIQNGGIGSAKMVRIYRLEKPKDLQFKEALFAVLYTDLKFLTEQLSAINQVYVKTVQYTNTIISIQHIAKEISHIAVNFTNENSPPLFKLEVAGTEGIIDFDSDKALPIYSNIALNCDYSVNYDERTRFMSTDNDSEILEILSMIEQSINDKKAVRRNAE